MNDFTKEELIIMYHNFAETEFRGTNNKLNGIRIKIRSLIDNHDKPCTHKNCRRISLLDGHDYDICPSCNFIRQVR
jgi:hypothetical protein